MYDLNDLLTDSAGYHVDGAAGINNAGQIIAYATDASGANRAVLLTPTTSIPLPPASWAALTALPLVLIFRRRSPARAFAGARRRPSRLE
jgi:hypothetical protein